jgi:hypothetical protein
MLMMVRDVCVECGMETRALEWRVRRGAPARGYDWLSCTVELTPHSPQSHSTVLVACSSSLKSLPGAPLVSMLAAKSDTHGVCGMWNRMGASKVHDHDSHACAAWCRLEREWSKISSPGYSHCPCKLVHALSTVPDGVFGILGSSGP